MFIPNGTTDVIVINGVHVPCHPDGEIISIRYPLRMWSSTILISPYMLRNRRYFTGKWPNFFGTNIPWANNTIPSIWCLMFDSSTPHAIYTGFMVLCLVVVISEFFNHSVIQVINLPISFRVTSLPLCHWSTPVRYWQQPLVTQHNQAQESPNRAVS